MCNPSWTAIQCILAVYFSQLLMIVLGIAAIFIGVISSIKFKGVETSRIPMSRQLRVGLLILGVLLIIIGAGWILINQIQNPIINRQSTALPSPVGISLGGATFISGDWNPKMLDLRNAASEGIHVSTDESFKLADLQIIVPDGTPTSYQAQVQVTANDNGASHRRDEASQPVSRNSFIGRCYPDKLPAFQYSRCLASTRRLGRANTLTECI